LGGRVNLSESSGVDPELQNVSGQLVRSFDARAKLTQAGFVELGGVSLVQAGVKRMYGVVGEAVDANICLQLGPGIRGRGDLLSKQVAKAIQVEGALHNGVEEALFVAEVIVKHGGSHTCLSTDLPHRSGGGPLAGEEVTRCPQDCMLGCALLYEIAFRIRMS